MPPTFRSKRPGSSRPGTAPAVFSEPRFGYRMAKAKQTEKQPTINSRALTVYPVSARLLRLAETPDGTRYPGYLAGYPRRIPDSGHRPGCRLPVVVGSRWLALILQVSRPPTLHQPHQGPRPGFVYPTVQVSGPNWKNGVLKQPSSQVKGQLAPVNATGAPIPEELGLVANTTGSA